MRHSVAPSGLYIIAILAPTASAVGYGVPPLMGLAATHPSGVRVRKKSPALKIRRLWCNSHDPDWNYDTEVGVLNGLFQRRVSWFLFYARTDHRVHRPLVFSSRLLSWPNWGVALPNTLNTPPARSPSGAKSGGGAGCTGRSPVRILSPSTGGFQVRAWYRAGRVSGRPAWRIRSWKRLTARRNASLSATATLIS